jgi:hypothetical protein
MIRIILVLLVFSLALKATEDCLLPTHYYLPTKNFCSSFPYITGETFRALADHVFDPVTSLNLSNIQPGDTIFIFFDYLDYFFYHLHPQINCPYIIITHHFYGESDSSVPGDALARYLNDDKLIAWFALNIDRVHPKLHPLPIGISTPFYSYGDTKNFDWCIQAIPRIKKTGLLYLNFANRLDVPDRMYVYELFKDKKFCHTITPYEPNMPYPSSHKHFLLQLATHKFILSPRGHGLDCFRTWETLLMGSYPVVKASTLDPLYENLPVVIVNEWEEVTPLLLQSKECEFKNKKFQKEKLYMPYWQEQIQAIKIQYLRNLK